MGIPNTEFSEEFVAGMRARMAVSFHKYGPIRDAYPHKVNALELVVVRAWFTLRKAIDALLTFESEQEKKS